MAHPAAKAVGVVYLLDVQGLIMEDFTPDQMRVLDALDQMKKSKKGIRSAFFWTTHKCASTFTSFLLSQIGKTGKIEHFDFAKAISHLGDRVDWPNRYDIVREDGTILYRDFGEVYGPIRKPINLQNPGNFKHIFFLRDPRDVIVSAYYGFGYAKANLPKGDRAKKIFLDTRKKIQNTTIDEYAIESSKNWLLPIYTQYRDLYLSVDNASFFNYDCYVSNPHAFISGVFKALDLDELPEEITQKLSRMAKPVAKDKGSAEFGHKRSGRSRQFEAELSEPALVEINEILGPVLDAWGFELRSAPTHKA